MTTDLAAELAALAADVQARAINLADRIKAATPDGSEPNLYLTYLPLAADMLADASRQIAKQGLHIDPGPADLDTADPDVDELLRQFAAA